MSALQPDVWTSLDQSDRDAAAAAEEKELDSLRFRISQLEDEIGAEPSSAKQVILTDKMRGMQAEVDQRTLRLRELMTVRQPTGGTWRQLFSGDFARLGLEGGGANWNGMMADAHNFQTFWNLGCLFLCSPHCQSQSQDAVVYFGWRVGMAVAMFALTLWSMVAWSVGINDDLNNVGVASEGLPMQLWFTKFTHWSLLAQLSYFVMAAVSSGLAIWGRWTTDTKYSVEMSRRSCLLQCKLRTEKTPTCCYVFGTQAGVPWFISATLILQNISLCSSLMTLWLLPYLIASQPIEFAVQVWVHLGILFYMVDHVLGGQPIYLAHAPFALLFSLMFLVFTAAYWAAGGTLEDGSPYIYGNLDWGAAASASTIFAILALMGFPTAYLLSVAPYRVNLHLHDPAADKPRPTESTPILGV